MLKIQDIKIGIIGLGYVGFPLLCELSSSFEVVGYDINEARVAELLNGNDRTNEVSDLDKFLNRRVKLTSQKNDLSSCNFYIVTVPTPVDAHRVPDLEALRSASKIVGENLRADNIVVFESTVYPGTTQEICVPILIEQSKLKFNEQFFVGYSPERINPGDTTRSIKSIVKLTSGSSIDAAKIIDEVYSKVFDITYSTPSINVAEAAKLIENVQRDVNIALVNELAKYFEFLGLDTNDVLDAACTKWNFLNFRPGLVGGHCIGIDPHYLLHQAKKLDFFPEIISSARRINDGMARYVAAEFVKALFAKLKDRNNIRILILGITFKENCPDTRNTQIVSLYRELTAYGLAVDIHDPIANKQEVASNYGLNLLTTVPKNTYDGIILAVPHSEFLTFDNAKIRSFGKSHHLLFDLKGKLDRKIVDKRL